MHHGKSSSNCKQQTFKTAKMMSQLMIIDGANFVKDKNLKLFINFTSLNIYDF